MKRLIILLSLNILVISATTIPLLPMRVSAAPFTCPDGTIVEKEPTQTMEEACAGHLNDSGNPTGCTPKSSFLGLPTWYKYLPGKLDIKGECVPQISECTANVDATLNTCENGSGVDIGKVWLIGLAILDLLLRLAGIAAVGTVIYGGFKYITSQGSPDATKAARETIIHAFIGMVITMVASVSVNFIAKLLQ